MSDKECLHINVYTENAFIYIYTSEEMCVRAKLGPTQLSSMTNAK